MRKTKLLSILIIAIMLLIAICPVATFAAETDTVTIEFEDSDFATVIYRSMGGMVPNSGIELLDNKVIAPKEKVDELKGIANTDSTINVKSLKGIENFTNLERCCFSNGRNRNF